MTRAIHRVTADSKRGRSMISPGTNFSPWSVPDDIREHNKAVDAKKKLKHLMRIQRKMVAKIEAGETK